jgi:thiol-disulfide isomerase/thioredoxin
MRGSTSGDDFVARDKTRDKGQARRARARRKRSGSLNWVLIVVAVALVGTVAFAVRHRGAAHQNAAAPLQVKPTPASDAIMKDFESIPAATWSAVGTVDAGPPVFVGDSLAAGGKPVVLYIGAGYCPYCAAARWWVIASLSRFGTFSGLTLEASSTVDVYPSTPTFSFYGSHYTSPYIDLETVELQSSVIVGNHYEALEKPTPAQQALLDKYDAPPYLEKAFAGGIPFILVGGRYMWSGSPFSPEVLAHHSQADIAATLPKGAGSAAQLILAQGNVFTAAICAVDGNQPAEVCSDPTIRRAIEALPHKAP